MAIRSFLLLATLTLAQPSELVSRWQEDVTVAREQFLAKDLSFTPERRATARKRLDRLHARIPLLTDQQIVAELARVAALADNGHTRAYLLRNRGWWRRYPVRIWKFDDGWRIVAVRPGQEALLGARILRIGGKAVASAEAATRPLFAGPATWASYMASYTLTSPDALLGTGVIEGEGAAQFDLERDGRRWATRLVPVEEPPRTTPEESWWFLSPGHPATEGWVQLMAGRKLPAYLAQPGEWYRLAACDAGILYLPFSRSEDQPGRPTLAEFGERVLETIEKAEDARLVIDLRFNTGGNLLKTRALFEDLARSPLGQTRGRLFVILGPSTFSAGITPAAILKQQSKAIFVGTEPGDRLHFWAEGGNVRLPNSGINLHYADRAHAYGPGGRPVPEELVYLRLNASSLRPDLPAGLRFHDYLTGRDPAAQRIEPKGLQCDAPEPGQTPPLAM